MQEQRKFLGGNIDLKSESEPLVCPVDKADPSLNKEIS